MIESEYLKLTAAELKPGDLFKEPAQYNFREVSRVVKIPEHPDLQKGLWNFILVVRVNEFPLKYMPDQPFHVLRERR